jgi:DNA-binding beta-propeller fold protein YncE
MRTRIGLASSRKQRSAMGSLRPALPMALFFVIAFFLAGMYFAGSVSIAASGGERVWVVDTHDMDSQSTVIALDPDSGRVLRSLRVGYSPDLAVARDGTRVYVGSTYPNGDVLQTFDAQTGALLSKVNNPDRGVWGGLPPTSLMVTSESGDRLYMLKRHTMKAGDVTWISTFDTKNFRFLDKTIPIQHCPSAALHAFSSSGLEVVCGGENMVYAFQVGNNGQAVGERTLQLPAPGKTLLTGETHPDGDVRLAGWSSRKPELFLIKLDGAIVKVNTQTLSVVAERSEALPGMAVLGGDEAVLSPAGDMLLVPCNRADEYPELHFSIAIYDPATLKLLRIQPVDAGFMDLTATPDGRAVLLTVPRSHTVVKMQMGNGTLQYSAEYPVGRTPALVR